MKKLIQLKIVLPLILCIAIFNIMSAALVGILGAVTSDSSRGDCAAITSVPSTPTSTDSSQASDSDWTQPGTTANKTAEKVFMAFVNSGTSGAFAAGVVGWVNSEGGFAMIGRAEGHYGNDIRTNSIAYGVKPIGLSYYTHEAGGGIFQFTPFTKYAPLGSPDWEDADKMISFVMKEMSRGDWNAAMDLTGKNHSFESAVKLTDPQEATLTWQAYERGNVAYINQAQKKADALKAYQVFNGDKYQYDEMKFRNTFGQNASSGPGVPSTTESESSTSKDCNKLGDGQIIGNGEYAHIFDSPYQVLQPYGYTPWSLGAGYNLYSASKGKHTGVDVATIKVDDSMNVPVYSITNGTVYSVSYSSLGGHAITIQPEGTKDYLYYGHLKSAPTLKSGDQVKKGQPIAILGHSGQTNIYHVHLEYSTSPIMATGVFDKDPSFLFQKSGTLKQNQIIIPGSKGEDNGQK